MLRGALPEGSHLAAGAGGEGARAAGVAAATVHGQRSQGQTAPRDVHAAPEERPRIREAQVPDLQRPRALLQALRQGRANVVAQRHHERAGSGEAGGEEVPGREGGLGDLAVPLHDGPSGPVHGVLRLRRRGTGARRGRRAGARDWDERGGCRVCAGQAAAGDRAEGRGGGPRRGGDGRRESRGGCGERARGGGGRGGCRARPPAPPRAAHPRKPRGGKRPRNRRGTQDRRTARQVHRGKDGR